ncbi:MAG: hypothetical protein MN733_34530 [Nitrososphaera sp.]|nr:hypothetical protein [Nitrososphaera sp.]
MPYYYIEVRPKGSSGPWERKCPDTYDEVMANHIIAGGRYFPNDYRKVPVAEEPGSQTANKGRFCLGDLKFAKLNHAIQILNVYFDTLKITGYIRDEESDACIISTYKGLITNVRIDAIRPIFVDPMMKSV